MSDKEKCLLLFGVYRHLLCDKQGYPQIYNDLYIKYRHSIYAKTVGDIYCKCCSKFNKRVGIYR